MIDPIPAFHRLEDLIDRRKITGEPAETVRRLRGRLAGMRNASSAEWTTFYRDALEAARALDRGAAAPSADLTSAERRYLEGLLADVKEAPSSIAELWSRRLQDQRDELLSKAREEVAGLKLSPAVEARRLQVRLAERDRRQWADWLEHYLSLWSDRVVAEVPEGIRRAMADGVGRAPADLAPHIPALPPVPNEPFAAKVDRDWSGLSSEGPLAGAWHLFGRSIRGGVFAVMTIATIGGSAAAALAGTQGSPLRGLIVLLLLIPVAVWARLSSAAQYREALEATQQKLEDEVRQRLLTLTQARIDARFRSLRGWLQRAVRAARSEAQAWLRACQLRLAESSDRRADARTSAALSEIVRDLETRVGSLVS